MRNFEFSLQFNGHPRRLETSTSLHGLEMGWATSQLLLIVIS